MNCPHCHSKNTRKNGHAPNGKQNHLCNECKRQYLEGGQDFFVTDYQKESIKKLLLERISLAGICRVVGVSEQWLYSFVKKVYDETPDDLNANLEIPDMKEYLEERFDEEIERLVKKR